MDTRELFKKTTVGVSRAILIALHTTKVAFTPGGLGRAIQSMEEFEDKVFGKPTREQIKNALKYLRRKKLVEVQHQYQKDVFALTKLGWWRTRKLLKSFGIAKPKKWDGKWRLIIFDIPDVKKSTAEVFRNSLKRLGLVNLQKSIWVHPYECRDQVYYLAGSMFIKPYVRYVVAEEVTGQQDLKKRFNL